MNPRVTRVRALDDHALSVTFASGETKHFDVRPYFGYRAFGRLQDPAFFREVRVVNGTASWPGGIDFDPDTLYIDGVATTGAVVTIAV